MTRFFTTVALLIGLSACDLGPRPEIPDLAPNYTLTHKIAALDVRFAENARIIGLAENPAERKGQLQTLEDLIKEDLKDRLQPNFTGPMLAVLQVDLVRLILSDAKTIVVGKDVQNQLYGNIYLADVATEEILEQSGVRIRDFAFKVDGNLGAILTATANNKRSFKRRFKSLARQFTDRASLILK